MWIVFGIMAFFAMYASGHTVFILTELHLTNDQRDSYAFKALVLIGIAVVLALGLILTV